MSPQFAVRWSTWICSGGGGSTTAVAGFQTCRKSPGKDGPSQMIAWSEPVVEHGEPRFFDVLSENAVVEPFLLKNIIY